MREWQTNCEASLIIWFRWIYTWGVRVFPEISQSTRVRLWDSAASEALYGRNRQWPMAVMIEATNVPRNISKAEPACTHPQTYIYTCIHIYVHANIHTNQGSSRVNDFWVTKFELVLITRAAFRRFCGIFCRKWHTNSINNKVTHHNLWILAPFWSNQSNCEICVKTISRASD